jgi:sugar lactone lactonase YvrE
MSLETRLLQVMLVVLSLAFGIQAQGAETRNLFVADQTAGIIVLFSPSGEDLGIFASGLNGPTGLAFDKACNLYVSEIAGNTIHRFSPSGEDLGYFATTGLSTPRGIAFDKAANLYVANSIESGSGWIRKSLRLEKTWATSPLLG